MTDQIIKEIREQNDMFRKQFGVLSNVEQEIQGKYMITQGFNTLSLVDQLLAGTKIRNYDIFNYDNDPYGEHDYGQIKVNGYDIMWKIDYYDLNYEYGSDDPSNPEITRRVLTAMMAYEY